MKFTKLGGAPKLEEGQYDAVLICVIDLGMQPGKPDSVWPKSRQPSPKILLVFEIPEQKNEDGSTMVQGYTVNASEHPDSYICKAVTALTGKKLKGDALSEIVMDGSLLGKAASVSIEHWESADGYKKLKIAEVIALHPKVPKPVATRPSIIFDTDKPDIKVWEDLTFYTKKKIMGSLGAVCLPKDIQAAWVRDQEQQASDGKVEDVQVEAKSDDDMGAIQ